MLPVAVTMAATVAELQPGVLAMSAVAAVVVMAWIDGVQCCCCWFHCVTAIVQLLTEIVRVSNVFAPK